MKICNLLKVEHIFLDIALSDKNDVLYFIAEMAAKTGVVENKTMLCGGLNKREDLMSTGIGDGIALPHATAPDLSTAAVFLIRLANPIDYDALDFRPVDIVLPLIIPENNTPLHLQLLAGVSRLCKVPEFLTTIRQAQDSSELWHDIHLLEEQMAFH